MTENEVEWLLESLRREVAVQFKSVDYRLKEVDRRFDAIDRRLDSVEAELRARGSVNRA